MEWNEKEELKSLLAANKVLKNKFLPCLYRVESRRVNWDVREASKQSYRNKWTKMVWIVCRTCKSVYKQSMIRGPMALRPSMAS